MQFLTLALIANRDVKAASYDRGGLRSTKHSTITGLLCAVTRRSGEPPHAWVGEKIPNEQGWAPLDIAKIESLLLYIEAQQKAGCRLVTWDGLRESLAILAKFAEGASKQACVDIALRHIDIAFQLFCSRGFIISLKSILKSMGVADKTHGQRTAFARSTWDKGKEAQITLLKVAAEVTGTITQLYSAIQESGNLTWLTKDKAEAYWPPETAYDIMSKEDRLLIVEEALRLPEPDVSWMSTPFKKDRGDFLLWLTEKVDPPTTEIVRVDDPPLEALETDEEELPDNLVVLDLIDPIARFAVRNYALLIRSTQTEIAKALLARVKNFER